jgi:predicted protein tyrosine phosphatase
MREAAVEWADVIFVMERAHRNKLLKRFRPYLMDPALVRLHLIP